MHDSPFVLLIKEFGADRFRRVDVKSLPCTIGNFPGADVNVQFTLGDMRVRLEQRDDRYCAIDLTRHADDRTRGAWIKSLTTFQASGVRVRFLVLPTPSIPPESTPIPAPPAAPEPSAPRLWRFGPCRVRRRSRPRRGPALDAHDYLRNLEQLRRKLRETPGFLATDA